MWLCCTHTDGNAFILKSASDFDSAVADVRGGNCWAAIYFGPLYSVDLIERFVLHNNSTAVLTGSTVQVCVCV